MEERIFEPTPQRLAQARHDGNVARSASLTTVVSLLSGCLMFWWYGGQFVDRLGWFLRERLSSAANLQFTMDDATELSLSTSRWLGELLLPIVSCVFVGALVANLSQGGFVWAPKRIAPDLSRLVPGKRIAATFSLDRLVDVMIELLKMGICLAVAAIGLWTKREELAAGSGGIYESFAAASRCVFHVLFLSLAALGCVSLMEYWLTTLRHRRSLRMTAEEWQAEMKERESTVAVSKLRKFSTGNPSSDLD